MEISSAYMKREKERVVVRDDETRLISAEYYICRLNLEQVGSERVSKLRVVKRSL